MGKYQGCKTSLVLISFFAVLLIVNENKSQWIFFLLPCLWLKAITTCKYCDYCYYHDYDYGFPSADLCGGCCLRGVAVCELGLSVMTKVASKRTLVCT